MKLTTENKQLTRLAELMQSERDHLFRYACYRLGSAAEADDVVQDLYLRLSKQGARLAEIEDLKGYVYRSLTNNCTSALRSRRQFATIETLDTLSSDDLAPKDFEQEFRLIERLMALLPDERDRYKQNNTALLSDIEWMQIDSTTMAVDAKALRLTIDEYERFRAADAEKIRQMGIKIKDLQAATKHRLEVAAPINAVIRDTIFIRDTVPVIQQKVEMVSPHI